MVGLAAVGFFVLWMIMIPSEYDGHAHFISRILGMEVIGLSLLWDETWISAGWKAEGNDCPGWQGSQHEREAARNECPHTRDETLMAQERGRCRVFSSLHIT